MAVSISASDMPRPVSLMLMLTTASWRTPTSMRMRPLAGVNFTGAPIASLAPGGIDSTTFTATYALTQDDINAGTFTNTATVTGTPPVGNNVTGSDPETVSLPRVPSISLVKTAVDSASDSDMLIWDDTSANGRPDAG